MNMKPARLAYSETLPAYPMSPPPSPPPKEAKRFLEALRRQWWIVMLAIILVGGGAAGFILTQPDKFSSQARMWVRGKIQVSNVGQYTEDLQNFFGTQIELVQSGEIQQRALNRVKASHPQIVPPVDASGQPVLPKITVSQAPKSAVFDLKAVSENSEFVRLYLDALMEEFLAYKKEIRNATSGDALSSVSEQVFKQERELKEEQEKLARFQRDNNVAFLEEQVRGGGSQLAQLQAQLSMLRLEHQLLEATALEQQAGASAKTNFLAFTPDPSRLSGLSAATSTPGDFVSAQQQLQVLKVQREQASRYLRPKHPKIIKLDEEIARGEKVLEFLRTRTQEQMAASKAAIEMRIRSMTNTVAELADKVGTANRKIAEFKAIEANIQRQLGLHDRLLTLLQGVDITSTMDQENVTILERATAPMPVNRLPLVIAAAVLAGTGLGLGIIFLRVQSDDRCKSLHELRHYFDEEIFGQVPEVTRKRKERTVPLFELNDRRHVFTEACRSLRSSLLFGHTHENRPRTILVTSAAPNEGKSTVAANLARALALGNSRVLLVDADLRRGQLHNLFGVPAEPGLSECIQEGGEIGNFIQGTSIANLFFLPRGKATLGSGELFLTPAFDAAIQRAREQFDYVIVDSVPVFAADDATTLAPKADGILFVVRHAHTSTRVAQEALEMLYQRQVNVLGLVFNRADSDQRSYPYYKYDKYHAATAA